MSNQSTATVPPKSANSGAAWLESLREAPASVVAPFEYAMLVTSFALSYLIWEVVPTAPVWIGAAIIMASGFWTIWMQVKASRS